MVVKESTTVIYGCNRKYCNLLKIQSDLNLKSFDSDSYHFKVQLLPRRPISSLKEKNRWLQQKIKIKIRWQKKNYKNGFEILKSDPISLSATLLYFLRKTF